MILMFVVHFAVAQTIVTGRLLDSDQKPISNVSVSYRKVAGAAIFGFAKSQEDGSFRLEIKVNDVDSVQLDFNHMSYAKRSVVVRNKSAHYAYILKQEARLIEEVRVGNLPVYKRKDTINYNVDAFTSKQDRVIADIIKKLPGIEMQGGQILYQGKPIQKYMVNNLDLMEGRYGMINNNLPADAVKNVQVVENDQPIKILDSLVFSDRASLNLELKKFTSTGTGKVGLGAAPFLWDSNLTPMTFGRTFQMLNSLQGNNTGNDVAKDLKAFYTGGGYFANNATVEDGPSYIFLRNVSTPGFAQEKWLNNQIFLGSTNVLQKLKDGLELKGNASYYNDLRKLSGFTATEIFTADQTILTSEAIDNRFRINVLDAGVLLEKNERQVYLRNSLKYHKRWNNDVGDLLFNESDRIVQHRKYEDQAFLNSLSMARLIGKQLVNIKSTVEWHQTPQRLAVVPGQLTAILNQGDPYEQMTQAVHFTSLRADNGLSFMRRFKMFTIAPSFDVNYQKRHLETDIRIRAHQEDRQLGDGYRNDLHTDQLQLGVSSRFSFENAKWKISLNTPYSFYTYNVTQQNVRTLSSESRNTFNPSATIRFALDQYHELSANGSTGRQIGGLDNFYNAYVVDSYRSIQRYNARLLENTSTNAGVSYNYRNTLKANFANMGYTYAHKSRDYIFRNTVDSLGQSTTGIEDRESGNSSHSLSGGIARFFSPIKTVVKLNANIGISGSDYLLNDVMAKQESKRFGGTLEIINNLSSVVSGEYKTTYGHSRNELAGGRSNTVIYNNHYLNLSIYPGDRHSLTVYNSYYGNNVSLQRAQYFLDAMYRYRVEKWKTDIEFSATNLLNNNQYLQQFSTNYQLVQSYFELRPRQFLLSTRFKF